MLAILGCRPLSNFFDPAKNAPKKPLKVVKRDKPNLADETEEREVDPDSAELVETTEDEANSANNSVVSQTNTNSNATNNTSNKNQETNQTAATKTFANGLIGKWSDGKETVTFNEKIAVFQWLNQDKPYNTTSYRVVNENTVEFTDEAGKANKATMTIEDGGNTLVWLNQNSGQTFKYKRITGANSQPNNQPETPTTQATPGVNNQQPKPTARRPEIPDQD